MTHKENINGLVISTHSLSITDRCFGYKDFMSSLSAWIPKCILISRSFQASGGGEYGISNQVTND